MNHQLINDNRYFAKYASLLIFSNKYLNILTVDNYSLISCLLLAFLDKDWKFSCLKKQNDLTFGCCVTLKFES